MTSSTNRTPTAAELAVLLNADGVLLFSSDGQDLTVADLWPANAKGSDLSMPVGFGVTGLVARTGSTTVLGADSPRNALHRELLQLKPRKTVARMCIPLRGLEDRIVGVETGGCPHTAIREDASLNLAAIADLLSLIHI